MTLDAFSMVVATAGALVTLVLFVALAYAQGDVRNFFFAGRSLDRGRVATNLAATATSLAGVLIFFLLQTPIYGWVVLVVLIFILSGYLTFLRAVHKVDPAPAETGSIYRFLYSRTRSNDISMVANAIVLMNFVVIFVIELAIGASIFAYLTGLMGTVVPYAAAAVGLFVLWYVLRGGFAAVTYSDTWQYWLVVIGVGLAFVLIVVTYILDDGTVSAVTTVFSNPRGSKWVVGSFLVNAVLVNIALPTTQITSWQRFSSAPSKKEWRKGYINGLLIRFWPLLLAAILISAVVFSSSGPISGFDTIFDLLRNAGILGALLVFPLFFVGLLAALVSTADSMLISIMLAYEDWRFGRSVTPGESALPEDVDAEEPHVRYRLLAVGAVVVAGSVFATWLLQSAGGNLYLKLVQLMFAGYGQAILLFPLIWLSARYEVQRYTAWPAIAGLIVGFIVLWSLSLYGILAQETAIVERLVWTHLAAPLALAAAAGGALMARRGA